jgi:hypothetical protein
MRFPLEIYSRGERRWGRNIPRKGSREYQREIFFIVRR